MPFIKLAKKLAIIGIVVFCYYYIIQRLFGFNEWNQVTISYTKLGLLVGIELALLTLNLSLETLKWQKLLSILKPVRFRHSLKMVLAGFTSGIITPFKAGEPIGRCSLLPKELFAQATFLNYTGGAIQTVIITIFGVTSFLFTPTNINIHNYYSKITSSILLIVLVLGVVLILTKIGLKTHKRYFKQLRTFPRRKLTSIIAKASYLSIVRYIIFCTQLFIALHFTCSPSEYILVIGLIFIYYFIITVFPSNLLIDMGIRGSVALYLFTDICHQQPANIMLAVFVIWLINQVIPAILGSRIILKSYLCKINHTEK